MCRILFWGPKILTNHKDSDMSLNKMVNQAAGWYLHKAVLKYKCAIMII